MADSKLKLPGDFDPAKTYLLKGETLLAWRKALLADRAIPGPGLTETPTPQGRILTAKPGGILPPFWPQFYPKEMVGETQTYVVTITPGWITDRDTKGGTGTDAIRLHDVPSLMDGDLPHEFPILPGESVFVKVAVDRTGAVLAPEIFDDPCTIVCETVGTETHSLHYVPPVAGTAGAEGYYLYKLATMTIEDGEIVPDYCLAGGHLDHYRDLPMFQKSGGTADVFKEYNLEDGKYRTRGITGAPGTTVTERDSDILIDAGGGLNLNLEIYQTYFSKATIDGVDHWIPSGSVDSAYPEETLYYRNGRLVSLTDPDGGNPPADLHTSKTSRITLQEAT